MLIRSWRSGNNESNVKKTDVVDFDRNLFLDNYPYMALIVKISTRLDYFDEIEFCTSYDFTNFATFWQCIFTLTFREKQFVNSLFYVGLTVSYVYNAIRTSLWCFTCILNLYNEIIIHIFLNYVPVKGVGGLNNLRP